MPLDLPCFIDTYTAELSIAQVTRVIQWVRVIIRSGNGQLLLVKQSDHAALAGRIMRAWRRDGLPESPRREVILLATDCHDDGWIDQDRAPLVGSTPGEILDYLHAPDEVRRGIWPRGVAVLSTHPYAAALVAQHALHLFERYRTEPAWRDFFTEMEGARAEQLAAAAPYTEDDLRGDYFFVRMGDLLSLQFCDDWYEPQADGPYVSTWDGERLTVTPDPFDGADVPLTVAARRLTVQMFSNGAELARAIDLAPIVTLSGVASGPRS